VLIDAFDENGLIVAWNKECEQVTAIERGGDRNPLALEWLYPDPDYRAAMLDDASKHASHSYRNRAWTCVPKTGRSARSPGATSALMCRSGWKEWGIGIDIMRADGSSWRCSKPANMSSAGSARKCTMAWDRSSRHWHCSPIVWPVSRARQ